MEASKESAVNFIDIEEEYSPTENLLCKFSLNHYTPQKDDKVSMFKLGWKSVKECVAFEWAPIGLPESAEHYVVFNKHELPKDQSGIYQICYISGENVLHGATIPFQFNSDPQWTNYCKNSSSIYKSINTTPLTFRTGKPDEIQRLKLENEQLRDLLKKLSLENNNKSLGSNKSYDKDIEELKTLTANLKRSIESQQNDINNLKFRITEAGKDYKKLYVEKLEIEEKYEKLLNKDTKNSYANFDKMFDIGELESIPPFPLGLNHANTQLNIV